jgi:hypothetical protein
MIFHDAVESGFEVLPRGLPSFLAFVATRFRYGIIHDVL